MEPGVGERLAQLRVAYKAGRVDRVDLCLRLRHGCARFEAPDVHPVVRVKLGAVSGGERQRQPELGVRIDERERLRHDADDRMRFAVDPNVASGGAASPEELLRESGAEDGHTVAARRLFLVGDRTTLGGRRADQAEEGRGHVHRMDALGHAVDVDARIAHIEQSLFFEHGGTT